MMILTEIKLAPKEKLVRLPAAAGIFLLGVGVFMAGCQAGPDVSSSPKIGNTRDTNPVVGLSSSSNPPTLIDLGRITSQGDIDYQFWDDSPDIEALGELTDSRELQIYHSSSDVTEVTLSTFDIDQEGNISSQRTIDCQHGDSEDEHCLIHPTDRDTLKVVVNVPSRSYATLQIVANVSGEDGSSSEQTTWLL